MQRSNLLASERKSGPINMTNNAATTANHETGGRSKALRSTNSQIPTRLPATFTE